MQKCIGCRQRFDFISTFFQKVISLADFSSVFLYTNIFTKLGLMPTIRVILSSDLKEDHDEADCRLLF